MTSTSALSAFRLRSFRRWAFADVISVSGSWMQTVAISLLVLRLTGSPTALGLSLAVQFTPGLLLGMWAGSVVDRLDRRKLLLVTQPLHAALSASIGALIVTGNVTMTWVALALVASGLLNVFDGPALGVFGQEVLGPDLLERASGLSALLNSVGRVIGMGSAGAVIAAAGIDGVFFYNALSFGAVIAAILHIRRSELHPLQRETQSRGAVRAGFRYVANHRLILTLLIFLFVLATFGRNMTVANAAMVLGPLRGSEADYALLAAVFSVGAVVGGAAAARLGLVGHRTLVAVVLASTAVQASAAAAPSLLVFSACSFLLGACMVAIDAIIVARITVSTTPTMRGRVGGLPVLTTNAASAIGAPLLGWTVENAGPRPALVLFAGIVVLACAPAAARLRTLMPT